MPGISISCSMPFIFILWRVDVASGTALPAIAQPLLHHRDLVALPDDDALAQDRDVLAGAVRRRPARHDDRLRVMRNHAGHELDVGVAVRQLPEAGRGLVDRGGCLRLSAGAGGERRPEREARPGDRGTQG